RRFSAFKLLMVLLLRRIFLWDLRTCLNHGIEDLFEIFKTGCRDNHVIATTIHIFCDTEEPTARILFQGKDESLPFDLNPFCLEGVLLYRRLWWHSTVL